MADLAEPTSRRTWYRRRLAAAAAASLALHLILAKGLALTSLGLDGRQPDAAAATQRSPKPRVDFTIRASKTPVASPAHERPLAIAAVRPAADRAAAARPASRTASERRQQDATEPAPAPAAAPGRRRDLALEAAATPDRAAPAPAPTTDATAASAAAAAPALADAAAAPAAATRSRDTAAAVASRWRPREVALLERLAAPAPPRPAIARADADTGLPAATPADRAQADADTAAATTTADATVAPAGVTEAPATTAPAPAPDRSQSNAANAAVRGTVAPRDRFAPRAGADASAATDLSGARARRETAPAATAAGRGPDRRVAAAAGPSGAATPLDARGGPASAASGAVAPGPATVAGSPRRGGGGAAVVGAPTSGGGAAAGAGDGLPSGMVPDARGLAALTGGGGRSAGATDGPAPEATRQAGRAAPAAGAGGGSGTADSVDTAAGGAPSGSATGGGGPGTGDAPTAAPGPRTVGRAADAAAGTAARAPAVSRGDGDARAAEIDGEAELSVPAIAAGTVGRPRRDDDGPAAGVPRPPERVSVVALPAEARVRDVAAAFARRGRDARPDRAADPRTARAEAVIDRGLVFLAKAQQADGRWSLGRFEGSGPADVPELASDTAATGLALLSFLGAGHDHFDGPHRDTVRRGLEFLLSVQKPDGDLYLPADELSNSCAWLYSHGIASISLCEAVGMTGDPLVRPAAARACGFIATTQHPDRGGWRYTPRSDADLSVSGWMLVALRSGALAGVETDPRGIAGVRVLLDAAAAADDPARYAYNPRKPDQRASELSGLCMTAVGALMRLHTGATPDDPRVAAAARVLAARRPTYDVQGRDSYLWYYASQVLVHTGGAEWDAWYAALVDALAATQETAAAKAGSWDPLGPRPDRWGRWGGRVYVTALHLLALEVPDRRLPTYTARE